MSNPPTKTTVLFGGAGDMEVVSLNKSVRCQTELRSLSF